jgi:hypothetical protein
VLVITVERPEPGQRIFTLEREFTRPLRYKILQTAARLTRAARQRQLKIQASWPWAADIVTAWTASAPSRTRSDQHNVPRPGETRARGP